MLAGCIALTLSYTRLHGTGSEILNLQAGLACMNILSHRRSQALTVCTEAKGLKTCMLIAVHVSAARCPMHVQSRHPDAPKL